MKLVYFSLTGQTEIFVNKFEYEKLEIEPTNPFLIMNEDFILFAPTYDMELTEIADDFLKTSSNLKYCKGVCGGGNRNFGQLFGFTAKDLSECYSIPLIHLFEFQGSQYDVDVVNNYINNNIQGEVS